MASVAALNLARRGTDTCPHVRGAGKVCNDFTSTAALALQPGVPVEKTEKVPKLRLYSLSNDVACGMATAKTGGDSVAETLKAGAVLGIDEYLRNRGEKIYQSTKREPLGKSFVRGHMMPDETREKEFVGFGKRFGELDDAKEIIFPTPREENPEEVEKGRLNYVKTHGSYAPGESVARSYKWPTAVGENPHFRFGLKDSDDGFKRGSGVKESLNMERDIGASYPKTKIVPRTSEDFRHLANDHLGTSRSFGQGKPPVAPGHAFGIKVEDEGLSTGELMGGNYTLEEQLPDWDVGRSIYSARRSASVRNRVYGVPSVRHDLPAPTMDRRSVADPRDYGDQAGARDLIRPQRFELLGVPDAEFVEPRSKDDIEGILKGAGYTVDQDLFNEAWQRIVQSNGGGEELVSLTQTMAVYSRLLGRRSVTPLTAG